MNAEERAGMPRWLKLSLLAAVVVAGLAVVIMLMSGAHKIPSHGPSGEDASTVNSQPGGHVPPSGAHG